MKACRSLVATPSVLDMMSDKLDWTQKLGDAVLAQQTDVMDAIQRLRAKADANNKLKSTKSKRFRRNPRAASRLSSLSRRIRKRSMCRTTIRLWSMARGPTRPIRRITGALATGRAAARFWGPAWRSARVTRLGVGPAAEAIGAATSTGPTTTSTSTPVGGNWKHNVDHRHGVRYNNTNVANKFNKGNNIRGGANNRMDFRGHNGQAALRPGGPGGDRPGGGAGAGNRPGGGDRPGGGAGAGNRPGGGGGGQKAATRPAGGGKPSAGTRPAGGGGRNAFAGSGGGGRAAAASASRGHTSMSARGGGGGARAGGGGGARAGGGGGGRGGGGGGRGGGGGGGRRSDIALKHDITLLGHLDNGIGFYRFSYNGSDKAYVGVMAQEVQVVAPDAVTRGHDGYLRVFYDKLGLQFQTYDQWLATGARIPSAAPQQH